MRARRVGFAIGVLALAVVAAWLAWPEEHVDVTGSDAGTSAAAGTAPTPGKIVPAAADRALDGGPWRIAGRVLEERDEGDRPAVGATVEVYAADELPGGTETCHDCGALLAWCEAPASVRAVLAHARAHAKGPRPSPIAVTTTDAKGDFSVEGLPRQSLRVVARTPQSQRSVDVTDRDATGEGLELYLPKLEPLSVTVVTEDDSPLPPITLTVLSIDTGEVREVRVGRDGRVPLDGLVGTLWVGAEVPGWLPIGSAVEGESEVVLRRPRVLVVHARLGGKPVEAEVHVVEHGDLRRRTQDGDARFVDLSEANVIVEANAGELTSAFVGVELAGTETEVTLELRRAVTLDVVVTDLAGSPIDGAWVGLTGTGGQIVEGEEGEVGRTRFAALPEGDYRLDVRAVRFAEFTRQVDLVPGNNEVKVALRPARYLSGIVLDPSGRPANEAEVTCADDVAGACELMTTSSDGRFEIEVTGGGTYTLDAYQQEIGRGTATARPGEDVTIRLRTGAVLEVQVIDANGETVDEALELHHETTREVRFARSAAPVGRIAGLAPGPWLIIVGREGRQVEERHVELGAEQSSRVTVRLSEGEPIDGRVLEADGKPAQGAQVVGVQNTTVRADEQGRFRVTGAKRGPVRLMAISDDGVRTASAEIEAPARDVVLRFDPLFRVTGRVVDEAGQPVRQFMVEAKAVMDARGRFSLELPRGSLVVSAEDYRPSTLEVTGDGDVGTVTLRRRAVLRGVVLFEGRPVPGATVRVAETMDEASTDASGRFEIPVLEDSDGPLHVAASRGALAGRAEAASSDAPVRVVLSRGTHVRGRVVDGEGAGRPTVVELSEGQDDSVVTEISTDEQGRFEVDLSAGLWSIGPRGVAPQAFTIAGASQEITLVDVGTCSVVLSDNSSVVWIVPPVVLGPVDWNTGSGLPAGSVPLSQLPPGRATSVPCGTWSLVRVADGRLFRASVTLQPGVVARIVPASHEPPAPP